MLLVIHNLPGNITYNEIKDFLRNKCGLDGFILDNLENENSRSKQITVGLAEETDAAILVRKVNGMYLKGQQLFVENIRQKKLSEQPYNSYNAQQGNMKSSDYNYSTHNAAMAPNIQGLQRPPNAPIPPLINPYQMVFGNMPCMPVLQAPAVANENGQQQWSADPGAYRNNVPFYQQQSYQTTELQQVTPAFVSETKRVSKTNIQSKNRSENQFQNVAYPDRVDRSTTLENDRDRYSSQKQERGVNDNQSRGYRSSDVNRDRDGNQDCGLNRGDRIVKFANHDRDSTCNVNVNREQDPVRTGTARESRWDVHVRNTREWASNDGSGAEHSKNVSVWKNEKNQPSQKIQFGDRSFHDRGVNSNSKEQFQPSGPFSISYNRSQFESTAPTIRTNYVSKETRYTKDNRMKRKYTPDESKSSNQGGKLPESSLKAPPGKKVKPNEIVKNPTERRPMAYSRRIKKHTTWICQVAANISKEVLKSAGLEQLDTIYEKVLKQLKKCILTRINMIYGNNFAESLIDVQERYTSKFKFEKYSDLYQRIRAKVEYELGKTAKAVSQNTAAAANKPKRPKKPVSPNTHIYNPYKVTSQNTPSQSKPGLRTEKSSITKPPAISELTNLPLLPESLPADAQLPTYPLGDKKAYKQIKQANKLGLNQAVLPEPEKTMLEKEIKKLQELFIQGCKEIDQQFSADNQTRWQLALKDFTKCVSNSVTNRILNVRNNLMVRIMFTPKKPTKAALETFLKKYDAISLKKSYRHKMYITACGTYTGFDALCHLEKTVIDGKTITFKPLHLTGVPKKDRPKKPGEEMSSSEESDDNEDQINEDIAECQQNLLNDTDVVLLEEEANVINLDETVDEIKPGVCEESDTVKDQDKNIDTNDEILQNVKNDDESKVTVENADTKNIVEQSDVKGNEDDNVTIGNGETEVTQNEITNTMSGEAAEKRNSPALVVGDNSYLVLDDVDNDDDHENDDQFEENLQNILSTADITEDDLEDF